MTVLLKLLEKGKLNFISTRNLMFMITVTDKTSVKFFTKNSLSSQYFYYAIDVVC